MRITFRSFLLTVILGAICFGVVYLLNKEGIDKSQAPVIEITPEKVVDTKDINFGDIVSIVGTPDLLNAVSLESREGDEVYYYFVPLKEYGTSYVVEIKQGKLLSELQTFVGSAVSLTGTEHESRIRNRLNKPVELSDDERENLDAETIEILTDQTTNDFTSKAVLIRDGNVPDLDAIYANIAFWGALLTATMLTFARRYIFR